MSTTTTNKRRSVNSPQPSKFPTSANLGQLAKLPPPKIEAVDFREHEELWMNGPQSFSLLSFCSADPDTLLNSSGGIIPSITPEEFSDWGFDVESLWGAYVRLRPLENHRDDALSWFMSFLTCEQVCEWLPSGELLLLKYFDGEHMRMDLMPIEGNQLTKLSNQSSRIRRPDAARAGA